MLFHVAWAGRAAAIGGRGGGVQATLEGFKCTLARPKVHKSLRNLSRPIC